MLALVKPFVDICLLRLGPQHLPASGTLLGVALLAHVLTTVALATATHGVAGALLEGVLGTLVPCLLIAGTLYVQRFGARLVQTLAALAGSGSVINVIALPLASWLQGTPPPDGAGADLARIAVLLLMGWSIAIAGHILRHAMSVSFIVGIVLALVFSWISVALVRAVVPAGV